MSAQRRLFLFYIHRHMLSYTFSLTDESMKLTERHHFVVVGILCCVHVLMVDIVLSQWSMMLDKRLFTLGKLLNLCKCCGAPYNQWRHISLGGKQQDLSKRRFYILFLFKVWFWWKLECKYRSRVWFQGQTLLLQFSCPQTFIFLQKTS